MKHFLLLLVLWLAAPVFAQEPPEIRFHSAPDFLQLPPDLYLGEATGVAVNSRATSLCSRAGARRAPLMPRPPRNCSSSLPMENLSARLATISMPGPLPTRSEEHTSELQSRTV